MTAVVFVLAGLVKGVVGLGLPTVSMALLALTMTPAQAAALLVVPSLVTNVWQMGPWRTLPSALVRLGPMQAGVGIGTLAGAWMLGAPSGAWARACLGGALLAYAAWTLAGARLSVGPRAERWLGPSVGASTGLVTAATGVFVIPAVPYLQALGLQRDALIQAMGLSFTVSTLALAIGLHATGHLSAPTIGTSAWMLLPALTGMYAGEMLRRRLSATLFRRIFLGSLALLGVHLLVREALA